MLPSTTTSLALAIEIAAVVVSALSGMIAASQQKQKGAIPVFNTLPAISVNSSASLDGEKKSALASAGVGEAGSLVAGLPVAA